MLAGGLEAVLRSVADAITVQDQQGRIVYANLAAAEILGFPDQESLLAAAPGEIVAGSICSMTRARRCPSRHSPAGRRYAG